MIGTSVKCAVALLSVCQVMSWVTGYDQKGGLQFNIDVDAILNNKRLLDAYSRCYLDQGPCPGPSREAKKYLGEIFRTNCAKCTKEQKTQTRIAFRKLKEKRPRDFAKVFAKYNPGNTHLASFTAWLKSNDS
uniref:Ejaculatory bulb-specific protein 3 n=2 Tax=Lygus TaxID=30084 RepID=A0A0A9Z6K2_LYGHE|nr:putative chemosensory protein 12 [Lygus hesperus]APB88075.1 putative chemosensory protein 12 [Lygus lineolaris]